MGASADGLHSAKVLTIDKVNLTKCVVYIDSVGTSFSAKKENYHFVQKELQKFCDSNTSRLYKCGNPYVNLKVSPLDASLKQNKWVKLSRARVF